VRKLSNYFKEIFGKQSKYRTDRQCCTTYFEHKYDLGLFQDPYKYCDVRAENEIFTTTNRLKQEKLHPIFSIA
jgi:hypothetical protein